MHVGKNAPRADLFHAKGPVSGIFACGQIDMQEARCLRGSSGLFGQEPRSPVEATAG
jgi:hypothetical protein